MKKNIIIAKRLIRIAQQMLSYDNLYPANIEKQIKNIKFDEYLTFKKINDNNWIAYPKNRNANLPDVYVQFDQNENKLYCGYNYINENQEDYKGVVQTSLVGLLEQLSMIKNKIHYLVVNLKNEQMDKQDQKGNEQGSDEEGGEEGGDEGGDEGLDLDLDLGGDEDEGGGEEESGGDEGGEEEESGGDQEA